MSINGIDVSKHNGAIDWQKVASTNVKFAFVRVGWAGYDGRIVANGGLDSLFHANMKAANAAGMDVGVYVYSYCKTATAARIAAQETLELIAPYQLTYPVAFDIEDAVHASMSNAENNVICETFLSTIQHSKYYAMLYTYKSFSETNLTISDLSSYDMWIAQWASKCTYAGNYGIWQYSHIGKVSGISGDVDLNIAYKDYPSLIRAAGLNGLSAETEPESEETSEDLRKRIVQLEHDIIVERNKHNTLTSELQALVDRWK